MDPEAVTHLDETLAALDASYVAPTPDGALLLVRTGTGDGGAILDAATGDERATFPTDPYLLPTPSPDGSHFATADGETVQVGALPDGEPVDTVPVPGGFAARGRNLLGPGGDVLYLPGPPFPPGDWTRFRTATGEAERSYPAVGVGAPWGADVRAFAVSADGSRVAVAGATGPVGGGFVEVYDAASGALVDDWPLAGEGDGVALSPDGSAVVATSEGATIHAAGWSASVAPGRAIDVRFVRAGRRILVATDGGVLALRNAETGSVEATREFGDEVAWVRSTEDASLVAVGTRAGGPPRLVAPRW